MLGREVTVQLYNRGYHVVTVVSPMEAFETVIRTRPDTIVASAVVEGVSGIELACDFGAMKSTRNIPFVLFTSFKRAHPELRESPEKATLIQHDRDLDDEITQVLEGSGLLIH